MDTSAKPTLPMSLQTIFSLNKPSVIIPVINKIINIRMRYADQLVESRLTTPDPQVKYRMTSTTLGQTSRLSRTTSFGQLNISNKLDTLLAAMKEMASELYQLRQQTTASLKEEQAIATELTRNLDTKTNSLKGQLRELRATMQGGMRVELARVDKVRQMSDSLFQESLNLKKRFIKLRSRIQSVENSMGYYGGQDKYKS